MADRAHPPRDNKKQLSRRALARTASWAAPVLAVSAVGAPAFASSTSPKAAKDIGSRIRLRVTCRYSDQPILSLQTSGDYPRGGVWVTGMEPGQELPSDLQLTFYFDSSYDLRWYNRSAPTWTALSVDTSVEQIPGFTAWNTRYSGGWHRAENGTVAVANDHLAFISRINNTQRGSCPQYVESYLRSRAAVDGEKLSILRGPLYVRPNS